MSEEITRRQRILDEATKHFLREGFERTSVDRIAAGARVSKQAIYEAFADKGRLFEAAVLAGMARDTQPRMPPPGDLADVLQGYAASLIERFHRPRNFGLFRANVTAMRHFPQLAAALHDYRRQADRGLIDYAAGALDTGALDFPSGDALDVATRLGGLAVEGTRYFLGYAKPPAVTRKVQARVATTLLLDGMPGIEADLTGLTDVADGTGDPASAKAAERPRLRIAEDRFKRLCAVSADIFLEDGIDKASIDKISGVSGVSRGTIYRQFSGKDELFNRVIGERIITTNQLFAAPSRGGLHGRLQSLARAILERHLDPEAMRLHRLLIEEAPIFTNVARSFYDARVASLTAAFTSIAVEETGVMPQPVVVRAFYSVATYGFRYVITQRTVSQQERDAVSAQAATIMARGLRGSR